MNKVLTFIIGLLCGSIITVLGFMIYIKTLEGNMMQPSENGGMYRPGEMGERPELPEGERPNGDMDAMLNPNQR